MIYQKIQDIINSLDISTIPSNRDQVHQQLINYIQEKVDNKKSFKAKH